MAITKTHIENNLQRIRERIAASCKKAGRPTKEVTLVAVTKSVEIDTIRHLLDLGLTELGESRALQFAQRVGEIDAYIQRRRNPLPSPVRWHMIGHLQRNKVKPIIETAGLIHSLDSLRLGEEINARAERLGIVSDVLLQVNCSKEPQKFGCAVGAALHLCEMLMTMKNLRLSGLMTMAPLSENPEDARPSFVRLRELFDEIRREGIGGAHFRHLSMGMSNDYPIAVEEGATLVRIGTALFE